METTMGFNDNVDWEEAFMYRPGQKVELKSQPGTFDIVASYDPMMVPPIWLVNDPRPRYAHELRPHPVGVGRFFTASLNKAAQMAERMRSLSQ